MKRSKLSLVGVFLVAALLIAIPLLSACKASESPPASSPKPSAPAAPAPSPKPAAQAIELKLTTQSMDVNSPHPNMIREFTKRVSEETGGRVTVKVFWGSVLGKTPDFLKMAGEGGVAQAAVLVTSYNQWEIPLWASSALPFLATGWRIVPKATWELYNEWQLMQDEMKRFGVKPLAAYQGYPHVIGLKESITSVTQLKGKKIAAFVFWPDYVTAEGIVNVPMTVGDVYDAMQKGTVSGYFGLPYHVAHDFKFYEIIKALIVLPFGGSPVNTLVVNVNTWNKIAPEDQKKIDAIGQDVMFNMVPRQQDEEEATIRKFYKDKGLEEVKLSNDELARIEKLGKDVIWGGWLKTANGKGVPADEWLQRFQAKIKALSK